MEEAERGTVGRQQVLYIVVSVGRYSIDRKDTIFYPKQSRGRERDNEPEREVGKERNAGTCVFVKRCNRQYIIGNTSQFK